MMKSLVFLMISSWSFTFGQVCKDCKSLYDQKMYVDVINNIGTKADSATIDELVLLAKSYQQLEMKKDAIGAYSHILLEDENNIDALVAVSALFIEMEEYENAEFAIQKVLKLEPQNEMALYNKAAIYFYAKTETQFFDFVNDLVTKVESKTDFLHMKALKYIQLERFQDALTLLLDIEHTQPNFTNYRFYLAYCLYKTNEWNKAKLKLAESTKMEVDHAVDAYYYLAKIYVQENAKVEACEAYTNAINLGDITLTKEADDYCNAKKKKKRAGERALNVSL